MTKIIRIGAFAKEWMKDLKTDKEIEEELSKLLCTKKMINIAKKLYDKDYESPDFTDTKKTGEIKWKN